MVPEFELLLHSSKVVDASKVYNPARPLDEIAGVGAPAGVDAAAGVGAPAGVGALAGKFVIGAFVSGVGKAQFVGDNIEATGMSVLEDEWAGTVEKVFHHPQLHPNPRGTHFRRTL